MGQILFDGYLIEGPVMPKGTEVERVYSALLAKGKDAGTAARIAQAVTKQSLATGKPSKGDQGKWRKAASLHHVAAKATPKP